MKRILFVLLLVACNRAETAQQQTAAPPPSSGDAARGKELVAQYGCNVCHVIPGVPGPHGSLGPSLEGVASRPMISGGRVANTPQNLVQFIQSPGSLNPATSMPPIGLQGGEAEDIAAFLQTLR